MNDGNCYGCQVQSPTTGARQCPACGHVFQGNGWDGIDAHWRANHEDIMPYADFWAGLCQAHHGKLKRVRHNAERPVQWRIRPVKTIAPLLFCLALFGAPAVDAENKYDPVSNAESRHQGEMNALKEAVASIRESIDEYPGLKQLHLTRGGFRTLRAVFADPQDCEWIAGILREREPLVHWECE